MRRSRAIAVAAVLAAISSGSWALAAAKSGSGNTRQPLGNNPHPVIWSSTKPKPAAPSPQPRASAPAQCSRQGGSNHDRDRHRDDGGRQRWHSRPRLYVPYYYGYYGYDGYPYGYSSPSGCLPGAGSGPQGVQQFMGMDNAGQARPDLVEPPEPKAGADRAGSAASTALAQKFIGYGDALFAKQEYVEANNRYRKAARSAPQLGAAWFRQSFALAAIGRYDLAAAAVKRGLKLDPAWPKSHFQIDQLFGPNELAKNARLDALAEAVTAKPTDPDRLFVQGVHLHFDGQTERAARLFERAEQLAGNNVGHIEAFLERE